MAEKKELMEELLNRIRRCQICLPHLAHGVNPVLSASTRSKIAIVGQAPGRMVHETGVPWQDKSGERLRAWLGIDEEEFYDEELIALVPMGFCYPGKGKSGDLPPRKECAPEWHDLLFKRMKELELTILVGAHAQRYYLGDQRQRTLTETVRNYEQYLPGFLALPHPSPRNNIWLTKNPWFEKNLIPNLKKKVRTLLARTD